MLGIEALLGLGLSYPPSLPPSLPPPPLPPSLSLPLPFPPPPPLPPSLQAKSCAEQLLLEMSVLGSWVTETELAVQALAKRSKKPNGITTKFTETRAVSY